MFEGAVVVRSVDGHRVVVSLDGGEEGAHPDGFIDRIFTLQTETSLPIPIANEFAEATITLVHGNLFVDPARDGQGLHLQTEGFSLADPRPLTHSARVALASVDQNTERRRVVGIGLSQRLLPAEAGFALTQARDLEAYVPVDASACATSQPFSVLNGNEAAREVHCHNGFCPAGGPGSTGCGNGNCNVSCGNGYYACCDGVLCKCCAS